MSRFTLRRYFVGDTPLVEVLATLKRRFVESIVVPPPGDFRRVHRHLRTAQSCDMERTMWLIFDRSVDAGFRAGPQRFLVCYDQEFKNDSPLLMFDENKPAWVAHTTAPHGLTAAMINITRPWSRGTVRLCDPFGGTGTTWLESLKLPGLSTRTGDIEPISQTLVSDNVTVLASTSKELKEMAAALKKVADELALETYPIAYKTARALFVEAMDDSGSIVWRQSVMRRLRSWDLLDRLLFYVALRAHVRHGAAFRRQAEPWRAAYLKELRGVEAQIRALARLRANEERSAIPSAPDVCVGDYSLSCIVPSVVFRRAQSRIKVECVSWDATRRIGGPYDVIVTDPPYGFNTQEELTALAALYTRAIIVMLRSLKPTGQLVICLPDRSYTGRHIPSFSTRGWVTQQVQAEAQHLKLRVVVPGNVVPRPGELFRFPYYWESERALRRSILHFRFARA